MEPIFYGAGAVDEALTRKAHQWWQEAAAICRPDLSGFDHAAEFDNRIAWAAESDLEIGTVYSRFSTKLQHSTDDQVRECVQWAARNGIYVPPELISVDEGVKGKRLRRAGLERTKRILAERMAEVLLVFKASRLFRQAGKGYQFINEEVVEEGLRAVSVSQGIDTNDRKTWKLQLQIHGLLDDLLLDAIADHVRSGLTGLFLNNWVTGAIGVGYRRKELPGAPQTNRGRPRTMPEVDPEAALLIREHARLLLDGMSMKEGVRRWNLVDGPCDPRSTTGKMTYAAYRRLFANKRLVGKWEFGRRRNQFSTKLDYVKQVVQSDDEVSAVHCEELRILDDETFAALQQLLNAKKTGPRGPRRIRSLVLWDLTTEFFQCQSCSSAKTPVRFYQSGANGKGMQCKNADRCKHQSTVRRRDAVLAMCEQFAVLIGSDRDLHKLVIDEVLKQDSEADHTVTRRLADAKKRMKLLTNRVNDLFEIAGEGSQEDRAETKTRLRATQAERKTIQDAITDLQVKIAGSTSNISTSQATLVLADFDSVLKFAASGELGDDAVYKSLSIFRALTGCCVKVAVERRANRKRTNVRGVFIPNVIESTAQDEVEVWLRKPPRLDLIADRVRYLIDVEGFSHREAAKQLRMEGHEVNSGNVWYSYRRWFEMQGLPSPSLAYNNGKPRSSD